MNQANIRTNNNTLMLKCLNDNDENEIIRIAINNASDANAKNLKIIIDHDNTIIFEDDGDGMRKEELVNFLNQGYSNKKSNTFTEEGLGTVLYLRSQKIVVITHNIDGQVIKATVEEPLNSLNENKDISYSIEQAIVNKSKGTYIKIKNFQCENFKEKFNAEEINEFINLKTYVSFFRYADGNIYNLMSNINVLEEIQIVDRINNTYKKIEVKSKLLDNINPLCDNSKRIYKASSNYIRTFSFNITDTFDNTNIDFQIYGMFGGSNVQKQIIYSKGEAKHNTNKLGIYVANKFQSYFKIDYLFDDEILSDCHIIVNSCEFKLSNNRIINLDDKKIRFILKKTKEIIQRQINPDIKSSYYSIRKKEKLHYEQINKQNKMKKINEESNFKRNLNIKNIPILKQPHSEPEILSIITALLITYKDKCKFPFKEIKSYSSKSPIDLITVGLNGEDQFIELENKASNYFNHNHPYKLLDYLICWEMDLKINTEYNDGNFSYKLIVNDNYKYLSEYSTGKLVQIYELSSMIENINS